MKYTEARITRAIIAELGRLGWDIVAYDFPQSGSGVVLHPNRNERDDTKNKDSFIPDIVCVKGSIALFFENKDRFFEDDFNKLNSIRTMNVYTEDIYDLLGSRDYALYFGVGLPKISRHIEKAIINRDKVDFIISTDLRALYIEEINGFEL